MNTRIFVFILLYFIFFGVAILLILGFLNFIHPLFDSFSHFRIHFLYVILPLLFILMLLHKRFYRYLYMSLLSLCAFYLYNISQPFQPSSISKEKTHTLKHMQFNINFKNQKMQEVIKYIQDNPMDIITLQEVTKKQQRILETIKSNPDKNHKKATYPYQSYCYNRPVGAVAILSKHPFISKPLCFNGFVLAKVLIDNQPINIISTHLYWPYPYHQPMQVENLLPTLEKISSPLIISGDFNAVFWSQTVKKIAKASHTNIVNGLRWSINIETKLPLLSSMQLPIDHLLLSDEFEVKSIKVEKNLGSDHLPIVSEIVY